MENTIKLEIQDFGTHMVSFPTVSQLWEINAMKMALTSGQYDRMAMSRSKEIMDNVDMIDAAATFSVLIPQLRSRLSENIDSLGLKEGLVLVDAFVKYNTWYLEIKESIRKEIEEYKKQSTEHEEQKSNFENSETDT